MQSLINELSEELHICDNISENNCVNYLAISFFQ